MYTPSRERGALSVFSGRNPRVLITENLSNRQSFYLEDGHPLFYLGLRTDLPTEPTNVAIGFGLRPHPRHKGWYVCFRIHDNRVAAFLFTSQTHVEILELVSADEKKVVLKPVGDGIDFEADVD